jgi:hypothetical protein
MAKKADHAYHIAHNLQTARSAAGFANCSGAGFEHLLTATSAIARARTHVAALTPTDRASRQVTKLWGAVQRTERVVAKAQRNFKSCLR